MRVAGTALLQYLPHPIGYPFLPATAVPTTLAEAPIGVAAPPISVPIESVHASVARSAGLEAESPLIIGSIVAAKGILSTNAEAIADIQITIAIIILTFPPLTLLIKLAICSRIPVFSSPPTTIKRPVKKRRIL